MSTKILNKVKVTENHPVLERGGTVTGDTENFWRMQNAVKQQPRTDTHNYQMLAKDPLISG